LFLTFQATKFRQVLWRVVEVQAAATATSKEVVSEKAHREAKRLTPMDYSKIGILKLYDWSVKEREAHDKMMQKYREYLMKLSKEVSRPTSLESE
jgi:hypothetical protein